MYCCNCGAALPEGAKFCGSCGAPVMKAPDNKAEETVLSEDFFEKTETPAEETPVEEISAFEPVTEEPAEEPAKEEPAKEEPVPEPAVAAEEPEKQEGKPNYEPTDFSDEKFTEKFAPKQAYQPVYGVPVAPPPKPKTPGKGFAIAAMVLGIIGLLQYAAGPAALVYIEFLDFLFPLLALVFGCVARGKGCRGMSTAGIVMGIIGLVLFAAGICLNIFYPDWIDDLYIAIYGERFYFDDFDAEKLVRGLSRLF